MRGRWGRDERALPRRCGGRDPHDDRQGHSIRGVGPGNYPGALRKVGFERLGGGRKSTRFSLSGSSFGRTITAGVRDGTAVWLKMTAKP